MNFFRLRRATITHIDETSKTLYNNVQAKILGFGSIFKNGPLYKNAPLLGTYR